MSDVLNEDDVQRLLKHPDSDTRADIASKIAAQHTQLSESERHMAEEIFRVMVKDAEVRVRSALSRQLKENQMIPHDVAMALASDVEEVALPMLEFSEVLTDADLIEIVRSQAVSTKGAQAVARRPHVSEQLADALVDTRDEGVVATLVANKGARLAESTLNRVVDEFGESERVGKPLSQRPDLPVTVFERLMNQVSENIRSFLVGRKDLSPEQADALLVHTREMAVLGLTDSSADVEKLVDHLHANGRLTPSIVLRAVCMGDMDFFVTAMSRLAGVKIENANTLIYDAGKRGFDALYEKAKLPPVFHSAMRAAVDVAAQMEYDGEPNDRERFSRRMMERILTQYGDLGVEFEAGDLQYLLAKVNQLPPTFVSHPE